MHSSVFIIIGFPHEGREDVLDTVRLLGQARPGRFRWTYFFPFPGTRAHEISVEGGFVNAEKMERLKNFTDESCLEFDAGAQFPAPEDRPDHAVVRQRPFRPADGRVLPGQGR